MLGAGENRPRIKSLTHDLAMRRGESSELWSLAVSILMIFMMLLRCSAMPSIASCFSPSSRGECSFARFIDEGRVPHLFEEARDDLIDLR